MILNLFVSQHSLTAQFDLVLLALYVHTCMSLGVNFGRLDNVGVSVQEGCMSNMEQYEQVNVQVPKCTNKKSHDDVTLGLIVLSCLRWAGYKDGPMKRCPNKLSIMTLRN